MKPTIGFAMCGSFCTLRAALDALRVLAEDYRVIPIFFRGGRVDRQPLRHGEELSGAGGGHLRL